MDFVRVGYFIPLNGPLNGHPPSINKMLTRIQNPGHKQEKTTAGADI